MLQEGGTVEQLEVMVKRWRRSQTDESQQGRWITKKQLMEEPYRYTEQLSPNNIYVWFRVCEN